LPQNEALQALDLGENGITAVGASILAEALRSNRALQSLNLEGNSIGAEGSRHLAGALLQNKVLRDLNLGGNLILDEGARHLSEALANNQHVSHVSLEGNKIRARGLCHLAKLFPAGRGPLSLDLEGNWIRDGCVPELAAAVEGNKTLQHLALGRNILADDSTRCVASAHHKEESTLRSLSLEAANTELRVRCASVRPFADLSHARTRTPRAAGSTPRAQLRLHGISPRALPLSMALGPRCVHPQIHNKKPGHWTLPRPMERVMH